MRLETVKVYKGPNSVVINKTEEKIKEWNEAGYFTSSQQKKAASEKKAANSKEDLEEVKGGE